MKRVAPWLLPTLISPILGSSLFVFLVSTAYPQVPTWAWVVAGLIASGFAVVVGGMMAATDVALLKLKLREPPTGWRVWVMGALAPLPVLWSWKYLLKFAISGLPQFLLTFFLPMLIVALVLRFTLGTRPANWADK